MAQTVSPPSDTPRPLPRRPAPLQAQRAVRPPRLVPLDALWMIALALATMVVLALLPASAHAGKTGAALAVITVVLLYLLGWRARDRASGLIAGLLAATSLSFAAHAAAAPLDAAFVMLAVASLFSFVAGSSLIALGFAGLAAAARPDGLLLGFILLGLALAQGRRRAGLGALAFVLLAGVGWAIRSSLGQGHFPAIILDTHVWLGSWAITGGTAVVSWLLLPFLAELGEAPRRARWLPVALWALVYFVVETFLQIGNREATIFGLMPLWFALAGGGFSRLLPALTGDIPLPWLRYGLATVAVLSLLAICGRPWTHPTAPAVRPVMVPVRVLPPPLVAKPAAVLVPAAVTAAAVAAHHAAAPKAAAKPQPKPAPVKAVPKPAPVKAAPKPAAVKAAPKPAAPKPIVHAHSFYPRYYSHYQRHYSYRHWYRR